MASTQELSPVPTRLPHHPAAPLAALIAAAAAIRAQTFGNPLQGFDEQFYLLVGDRMVGAGALPLVDIFDRKPVGVFLIAALARLLGGEDGALIAWQALACAAAGATAWIVLRLADTMASARAAWGGALLYLTWLMFLEGDGGQAQVFMNLFMGMAALLVAPLLVGERDDLARRGTLAMLAAGIALQLKPTCGFEGALFGLALLWRARAARRRDLPRLALIWIGAALLPTALALAAYAALGQAHAFIFSQFISPFAKLPDPAWLTRAGARNVAALLALPLLLAALAPPMASPAARARRRFVLLWLAAAIAGLAAWGAVTSPQWALGALLPLAVAAAPAFDAPRRRWAAGAVLATGLIAGQIVAAELRHLRGGAPEAERLAAAAQPRSRCLYVYDGPPALYRLTHACLPTRFVFPGQLNMMNEANPASLGVDPRAELARILASEPETIVDTSPRFAGGNRATHAILARALARDYRLVLDLRLPSGVHKLVYRRVGMIAAPR